MLYCHWRDLIDEQVILVLEVALRAGAINHAGQISLEGGLDQALCSLQQLPYHPAHRTGMRKAGCYAFSFCRLAAMPLEYAGNQ